jgi:speckle-type POZ protein
VGHTGGAMPYKVFANYWVVDDESDEVVYNSHQFNPESSFVGDCEGCICTTWQPVNRSGRGKKSDNPFHNMGRFYRVHLESTDSIIVSANLEVFRNVVRQVDNTDHVRTEVVESLATAMSKLLITGKDSDVFFDLSTVKIPAHKMILEARSDVFKAMLDSGMSEGTGGEIVITDCDEPVFRAFLLFLYTDTVSPEALELYCVDLFMLAHKYQVAALQNVCEDHLLETVAVHNVIDRMALAETYTLKGLMKSAVRFVVLNYKSVMVGNPNFLVTVSHDSLVEIMTEMAK